MSIEIIAKDQQAYGAFNNGEIVENKPIGFPREGGPTKPYSNLFYWANDVMIQRWKLEGTHKIEDTDQIHSIYVLTNEVVVNGKRAVKDDFILADGESLTFTGSCELFVIGSARKLDYKTYVEMM